MAFNMTRLLRPLFDEIDTDHSGNLSKDEFNRYLSQNGYELSWQEFEDLFKSIDTDKSGELSFDEFIDALQLIDDKKLGAQRRPDNRGADRAREQKQSRPRERSRYHEEVEVEEEEEDDEDDERDYRRRREQVSPSTMYEASYSGSHRSQQHNQRTSSTSSRDTTVNRTCFRWVLLSGKWKRVQMG